MKMDIFLNKKAEQDFTLGWANHVYFSPLGYSSTYINWREGKGDFRWECEWGVMA